MWIYCETDGDAGYYNVRLFSSKELAEAYKTKKSDPYGCLVEIQPDAEAETKPLPYEDVKCPDCNGPMAPRTGQYGKFWGCKKYPNCRGTRDSMGRSKAEREQEKEKERLSKTFEQEPGYSFQKK